MKHLIKEEILKMYFLSVKLITEDDSHGAVEYTARNPAPSWLGLGFSGEEQASAFLAGPLCGGGGASEPTHCPEGKHRLHGQKAVANELT